MDWRVIVQGQAYETNLEELKQWIREGRVLPADQVFQPGLGWTIAGQVPELQACFPPGPTLPLMVGDEMTASPYNAPYPPPAPSAYAAPPEPYAPAYGLVGYAPQPYGQSLPAPAGLGKRFLGALLDSAFSLLCALPGLAIYLSAVLTDLRPDEEVPAGQATGGLLLFYLGLIAYTLLAAYMMSKVGASPGKKIVRAVVLREDGQFLSFGMAILREFLKGIFNNICSLLNMWLLFDPERQQLYDKITRANVYDAS